MSEEDVPDVPYYLMPVAALCGTYSLCAGFKALYQVYKVSTFNSKKSPTAIPPSPLKSKQFLVLILSVIGSALAYGYVCAQVNNSIASADVFDPFEILSLDANANITSIKSAYRSLSKTHHPDKGGDTATFQKINLAYKALSDETSRENWEKFGHPDGPQTQTLSFALPEWLLHPEGNVALALLVMYLGMFAGIIIYVVKFVTKTEETAKRSMMDNSVAQSDMSYLAMHLRPDSSHVDVLFYIATCPELIEIAQQEIDKGEELKKLRIEYLNPSKKKREDDGFDFGNDGGWAEDDDDDAQAAKAKEAEKERLAKEVAEASGNNIAKKIKIEGVDDGVVGQAWVEKSLSKLGQWPPKFSDVSAIPNMTFSVKGGNAVPALEHKAVRRNLCMTLGRLNARELNSDQELLAAGQKQLIDETYFRCTLNYRKRTGLLLEAALRVAGSVRSYRLYKTIVECCAMFKIGTTSVDDEKTLKWFNEVMDKTYQTRPGAKIDGVNIETPDEDEIATEDTCKLEIDITRTHAEAFTKQKIAQAQKQGIPPQIALQMYREGWWILIRCKKLDGDAPVDNAHMQKNPILAALDNGAKSKFEAEVEENRLLNAWPFLVSQVGQVTGKVNLRFPAPSTPGKYKFYIDIKSQEFLGCDQVITVEKEVVDKALIERKEEEEDGEDGDDGTTEEDVVEGEEEPKKTK